MNYFVHAAAANISVAKEQKQELSRYLENIDRAKEALKGQKLEVVYNF